MNVMIQSPTTPGLTATPASIPAAGVPGQLNPGGSEGGTPAAEQTGPTAEEAATQTADDTSAEQPSGEAEGRSEAQRSENSAAQSAEDGRDDKPAGDRPGDDKPADDKTDDKADDKADDKIDDRSRAAGPAANAAKPKRKAAPRKAAGTKTLVVVRDGRVQWADSEAVLIVDLDEAAAADTDVHDVVDRLAELRDALDCPGKTDAVRALTDLIQEKALG